MPSQLEESGRDKKALYLSLEYSAQFNYLVSSAVKIKNGN